MKLIIDIEKDYYEMLKYDVEHGQDFKPIKIIANGTPYTERPHGTWLYTPNIPNLSEYEGITCSICGNDSIGDFNFCPHCGADMRGKEE